MSAHKDQPNIQEASVDIIDFLLATEHGFYRQPAGELLHNLADGLHRDYFQVAHAVLYLEEAGLLKVERNNGRKAKKANRLTCIWLLS